jgi:hypothetical protein
MLRLIVLIASSLCIGAAALAAEPAASDFLLQPYTGRGPAARDKFQFFFGPAMRWSGTVHWSYNATGAPPQFDPTSVVSTLHAGMAQWSAVCGVTFAYDGPTSAVPTPPMSNDLDQVNVIGWGSADAYLAGAAGVTIDFYVPSSDGGGALYDADMVLDNTGRIPTQGALVFVTAHEAGHMLGLAHSELGGNLMSGPPDSAYTALATLQPDDVRGCRCMYGPAAGQGAGYTCSLPKRLDLGSVPVGSTSITQAFTVFNDGNVPLTVNGVTGGGSEVQVTGGCPAGTVVAPGDKCIVTVSATPNATGQRVQTLTVATSDGPYTVPAIYAGQSSPAATIQAVEYYNAGLDHYFITWVANEIAILDAGIKSHGWTRTGQHFTTYPSIQPGASPLCRYYIPPDKGNSHFYGRGADECARTGQNNPSFVLEDPAFMYMILPTNGACPAATTPVYRVFSNRPDANHRYMTDRALRDQMVSQGWLAEGDGPDLVVMCAPT